MSRWKRQYQEFVQSESWKNICQFVGRSDYAQITEDAERTLEAFRFKKMVNLVSSSLEAVDLEVIPSNNWAVINQQSNNIVNLIQNLEDPNDINNDYQQLNDQIDQIYTMIRSYLITDKAESQIVGQTFRSYQKDVEDAMEEISRKRKMAASEYEEKINIAQNLVNEIELMKTNIDEINKKLISEEGGVEHKFNTMYDNLMDKKDAIEKFNERLISNDEGKGSIIQQISIAKISIEKNDKEIKNLLDSLKISVGELQEFHTKMIGVPNEQGNFIGGFGQEIEDRNEKLINFEKEQKIQYEELKNSINELLPGAISAGLASAYLECKDNAASKVDKYTKCFAISITALVIIGVLVLCFSYNQTEWAHVSVNFIKYGPIFLPAIWGALFFSKRRNEMHRLEQEYAHKEALAKSYASFKHQIDILQEDDHKLLSMLLHKTIIAIAFNPSSTLDKTHDEKLPLDEILGRLKNIIEKSRESNI